MYMYELQKSISSSQLLIYRLNGLPLEKQEKFQIVKYSVFQWSEVFLL
jgi:hypothetical protein